MVAIPSTTTNGSSEDRNASLLSNLNYGSSERTSPYKRPSRKQWSLQEEPRSLLKKLRSQLAEDGCPESQYLMARALLEQKDDVNYEENCLQAIFWLTQASLQGCLDATALLKECLETGIGICEQNYLDIKKCIEMDQQEKLALVAAKELFNCLAEGSDFITVRKLEAKISGIINNEGNVPEEISQHVRRDSKREIKSYLEEMYGSKRLNEDQISAAGISIVNGELPSIKLKEKSIVNSRKVLWNKLPSLSHLLVKYIESFVLNKFTLSYVSQRILVSLMFISITIIFCCLNLRKIASFYLVVFWILSFIVMSYSVIYIIVLHKRKSIYGLWIIAFSHFTPSLDVDSANDKYKRNCIRYYFSYLTSMLIYLLLFPVVHSGIKAFVTPPFLIVSCVLLVSLFRTHFSYNVTSSFFYIFAHYLGGQTYIKNSMIQAIPSASHLLLNESLSIYGLVHFNLDIGAIFHSLWLVSLIFVSFTIGLYGIFHHIACITWFHMAFVAWGNSSGVGIYFSLIFWLIFCFLPRGLRLLTTFIPTLLIALCSLASGFSHLFTFTSSVLLIALFQVFHYFDSKLSSLFKFLVVSLSLVFLFQQNKEHNSQISSLNWEHYQNVCFSNKEANGIQNIRKCLALKGTVVQWQATVKQVEIKSVFNWPNYLLSFFPGIVQSRLRCYIGSPPTECKRESLSSEGDYQHCLIFQVAKGNECSLENWDEFEFSFIVSMESTFWKFSKTSDVILSAGNEFHPVAFNIMVHDKISFVGTLDNMLGNLQPEIILSAVNCVECRNKNLSVSTLQEIEFDSQMLFMSFKSTFNFILGPTFTM